MPKAAEAFRTISEVADTLDVPKHVLRFWELRFPQIKPMKRGGGRRYYRPTDVELLRGIRHLLHAEGYTIKGVQKILREQGVDQVKSAGRHDGEAEQPLVVPPTEAPSPPAEPVKGRGRGTKSKAPDKAVSTGARDTGKSPHVSSTVPSSTEPAASAGDDRVLLQLLKELRACRAILAGAAPAQSAAGRNRRAAAS